MKRGEENEEGVVELFAEPGKNGGCGVLTGCNGLHEGGGTGDGITAGVHLVHTGGEVFADDDVVMGICTDAVYGQVFKAQCQHNEVGLQRLGLAGGGAVGAAAGVVRRR